MNLERLYARLTLDEGKRHKPYRCSAGKLTIGVGRNLDDRGLTDSEIAFLLENDVALATADCRRLFYQFDDLDDVRQEVLVSMAFNLGFERLSGFKKLRAAVRARNWAAASREMLDSKWATQVGARAQRLAKAMQTGVAP